MLALFKRKSDKASLEKRYQSLSHEAFRLSRIDRRLSDEKLDEAENIMREIARLAH